MYKRIKSDPAVRNTLFLLGLFVAISVVIFALLWGVGKVAAVWIYDETSSHPMNWKEYLFCVQGAIDAAPGTKSGSIWYSWTVRLVGSLLLGGVITSFFCAIADRISDMTLRGYFVPPSLKDHFVIFGSKRITDDLVRFIVNPPSSADDIASWVPHARDNSIEHAPRRKILLYTGQEVEAVRDDLVNVLPSNVFSRISFVHGDMDISKDTDAICGRLAIKSARAVFILGDADADNVDSGDIQNLAIAKCVGDYLKRKVPGGRSARGVPQPIPIYVQQDGAGSFDSIKKIGFMTDSDKVSPSSYFKPFSFQEGWVRSVWGDFCAPAHGGCDTFDFAPLGKYDYVHLVVIGADSFGEAVVLEATRVAHYANGQKTRITMVAPRLSGQGKPSQRESFMARHPTYGDLVDIEISFIEAPVESEEVRELLRHEALNEHCLLSIAICKSDPDASLSSALNLPEEVYYQRGDAKNGTIRDKYRANGARVWVYQFHEGGLAEAASMNSRYRNVHAFGMQENGFKAWSLKEFNAMYLNAAYDWPCERAANGVNCLYFDSVRNVGPELSARIASFTSEWGDKLNPNDICDVPVAEKSELLRDVVSSSEDEILHFQEYAFRKYLAQDAFRRWANVYVSDSYGGMLRAIGLKVVPGSEPIPKLIMSNWNLFSSARTEFEGRFERSFAEVEHNRWIADRILMGYRPPREGSGEVRDDDYRYHKDIRPFSELNDSDKGKDELSIACIPLFVALRGYKLERR